MNRRGWLLGAAVAVGAAVVWVGLQWQRRETDRPAGARHVEPPPVTRAAGSESSPTLPTDSTARSASPTAVAAAATATSAVAAAASRLADAAIPLEQREAEIAALARQADAEAVAVLMAVGDASTYLNRAAVEALGGASGMEVVAYLRGKLDDADPQVLAAAVVSLARIGGAEAIDDIAGVLQRNRRRPDGQEDLVSAACVQALVLTRSPQAVPVLAAELDATTGSTLGHEYGSQVVAALKAIGARQAQPVFANYQARLERELDGMTDNPLGQQYLKMKIAETRAAAEGLGR